jgi:hypothetical protein
MHFQGAAVRWIQSVERRVASMGWDEFCTLVHDRFGHDQHEALIRKLFHIHQVGTVADYVERFSKLVGQLADYESTEYPVLCYVFH